MKSLKPKDAAEQIGISYPTIKQWIYEGKINSVKTPGGHHRIPETEVERLTGGSMSEAERGRSRTDPIEQQPISVRNKLLGEVLDVNYEGLFAEITMDVGGQLIVSIITRGGCEQLGLKKGMRAYALFKATEVMISRG
jgi:molybdopterin-binding protein